MEKPTVRNALYARGLKHPLCRELGLLPKVRLLSYAAGVVQRPTR